MKQKMALAQDVSFGPFTAAQVDLDLSDLPTTDLQSLSLPYSYSLAPGSDWDLFRLVVIFKYREMSGLDSGSPARLVIVPFISFLSLSLSLSLSLLSPPRK